MPPRRTDPVPAILAAALDLAGSGDWRSVRLVDIAERAGVPLPSVAERFTGRDAVLAAWFAGIDHAVLEGFDAGLMVESPRNRLFDVMMRRYDAMASRKNELAAIRRAVRHDPATMLALRGAMLASMARMVEAAGLASSGLAGAVRVRGLLAIHLAVLPTFLADEGEGLPRTMAALDRRLGQAERLVERLGNRGRTRPSSGNGAVQ